MNEVRAKARATGGAAAGRDRDEAAPLSSDRSSVSDPAERGPLRLLLLRATPESTGVTLLRQALDELHAPATVDEEHSLAGVLKRLDSGLDPEIVLLEPDLPDADGLKALETLATRYPAPLRVLLIGSDQEALGRAALKAGADDYVLPGETDARTVARILRYARRRRAAETDLRQAARRYRTLFERAPDGILVVDEQGILRDVNPRLAETFGYEAGELLGECVDKLVPDAKRGDHGGYRLAYADSPEARPMGRERELTGRRKDGTTFPIQVGLAPLPFPDRQLVVASVRDLSDVEGRRRLADIVDASDDVILGISVDGTIQSWNRGAAVRFGVGAEEAIGRPLSRFLSPEVLEALPEILRRVRAGEHVHAVENLLVTPEGRRVHLAFAFSPLANRAERVTGAAVIGRDITRRKILEADLEELAYKDPLTRVANRRFFRERLDYAVSLARREEARVGLVYLDMGGFKQINDRFGHSAGDAVLAEIARRLEALARESDLVARFGGDEFVILLSRVDDEQGALEATRRFEAAFQAPVLLADGREVPVEAEFGIALFPDHGDETDDLLAAADRAMYSRKEARWLDLPIANVPDRVALARLPTIERRIQEALSGNQFELFVQPVMRAGDESVAGAEILLRWRHPENGILSAGEFLSSVRDIGLLPAVDVWVLSRLLEAARLPRLSESGIWLAANLSDRTLTDEGALDSLISAIGDLALPAGGLRIELRESPALVDPLLVAGIERLREKGVTIVLDNYGIGHSSVAQLREIPADAMKVDGFFVRQLDVDPSADRLLRATIEIGLAADLQVGVEGIERSSQAARLRGDGCEFLQGFYFGRPAPLGDFSP